MGRRKLVFLYFSVAVFLSVALFQSCVEENIEEKFLNESEVAREYYLKKVLPILGQKCFSCHNYHNSSNTKYDSFLKASVVAEDLASRTSSENRNTVMPPPSSTPLTEEEKQTIQQFVRLVKGADKSSKETTEESRKGYGVSISWTAYKFPDFSDRVGVSGTFEEFFIIYKKKEAADIYEFLNEAEILIPTNSTNIGNDPLKSANVINHFFSYFTPVIHAQLISLDAPSKMAKVRFTINGLTQEVLFLMEEIEEDLVFTGQIQDIRYFNAKPALDVLQGVCGEFHQDKLWPDISLKAEIRNFRKFSGTPK